MYMYLFSVRNPTDVDSVAVLDLLDEQGFKVCAMLYLTRIHSFIRFNITSQKIIHFIITNIIWCAFFPTCPSF